MSETTAYDELLARARDFIQTGELPAASECRKLLNQLRDYREFDVMRELAESFTQADPYNPTTSKLYAQALIDSGSPALARDMLTAALARTAPGHPEHDDMHGVLGRAYKDIYSANHQSKHPAAAQSNARRAFEAYNTAYQKNKGENTYQGINAAALLASCDANGIDLGLGQNAKTIAREIIQNIDNKPTQDGWDIATLAEAHIPLGDWDEVESYLGKYLEDATPFQIGGTLRQFRDVWRVQDLGGHGPHILQMLEAAFLHASLEQGGEESNVLQFAPSHVSEVVEAEDIDPEHLEKVLGDTGPETLDWFKLGISRANSVASVVDETGRRTGTAFVVSAKSLGLAEPDDGLLMMTNYHVMNERGAGSALLPEDAFVRFEAIRNDKYKVEEILFESSYLRGGLDAAIFRISCDRNDVKDAKALPVEFRDLDHPVKNARVYIIGYPLGGELKISFQDNKLLDHECNGATSPPVPERRRLHYFAPTEPGNSGSPVFDQNWKCIGLHHAGKKHDPPKSSGMKKLNGQDGRHSANEGIWMTSIKAALAGQNT